MGVKQKFWVFFVILAGAVLFWPASSTHALKADWRVKSSYTVLENGSTQVKQIVEIENKDAAKTPEKVKLSVEGKNIKGLKGEGQDGRFAKATYNSSDNTIQLELPSDSSGKGKKWSFEVNYQTNLLDRFGDSQMLMIEPMYIDGATPVRHDVSVAIDMKLGFAVLRGPKPANSSVGIGNQIFKYSSKKGLIDRSLVYFFGDKAQAEVILDTELKNDSFWWKTKTIVLPPDTNQQKVIIDSIEPKPTKLRLDPDGNVIAEYNLSPKRSIKVTAKARVGINNLSYSLDNSSDQAGMDQELIERYTKLTDNWKASDLNVDESAAPAEMVQEIFDEVAKQVPANLVLNDFNGKERIGSLEFVDKLVGELRKRKIPSRVVVGKIASDGYTVLDKPASHAWAEAYIPGSGWVTLDPVMHNRGLNYGTTDILHVGFALWGIKDDFPPVDLNLWNVNYVDGEIPEQSQPTPAVIAEKTTILPGISLMKLGVSLPSGSILDGVAVQDEGGNLVKFGSVAPLQTASVKHFKLGAGAFSKEAFTPGYINDEGQFTALGAKVESTNNFTWLIVGALLAISGGITLFVIRRRMTSSVTKRTKNTFIVGSDNPGMVVEDQNLLPDEDIPLPPVEDRRPYNPATLPQVAQSPPVPIETPTLQSTQQPHPQQQQPEPADSFYADPAPPPPVEKKVVLPHLQPQYIPKIYEPTVARTTVRGLDIATQARNNVIVSSPQNPSPPHRPLVQG